MAAARRERRERRERQERQERQERCTRNLRSAGLPGSPRPVCVGSSLGPDNPSCSGMVSIRRVSCSHSESRRVRVPSVSLRGVGGGRGEHGRAPAISPGISWQGGSRRTVCGPLGGVRWAGSSVLDLVPVALRAVASVGRDELLMIDLHHVLPGLCGG
jgi:hypothetical protein